VAGRNLLQRDKTTATYQILHWNKPESCDDSGMDCPNNNTYPKGTQGNG